MDVTVTDEEQVRVARLVGRLDFLSAPEVKNRLSEEVVPSGILVVDLEGVDFMDSSGLGAIVGGLKAARQVSGDLRIARPQSQVRMILQLTTLDRVLVPYDSVREACRSGG